MNPKLIKKLISQGESAAVEFKEEVDLSTREGQAEFCKDLMSLANVMRSIGKTSYLLIGVSDNGEIKGLKAPITAQQLKGAADLYCQPPVVFRYWQGIVDGKVIGVITIPQSYRKPHKFKREFSSEKKRFAENSVFTRHLSHVVLASPEEIVALDQEGAQLRRRRLMTLLGVALIVFLSLCIGTVTSGIAYARPIQEFATLFFPQGVPLMPSGFDPHAMPLVESQIDRATRSLTGSPFKAEYASRVIKSEGEYVSYLSFEYLDNDNYWIKIKANHGLTAFFGGEVTLIRKGGISSSIPPESGYRLEGPFEIPGLHTIREPLDETCAFMTERAQYKPWAKLVRISGKLVRVYERKAPATAYCLGPGELQGDVQEKVYIDLDTGVLVKYEAQGQFKSADNESVSYEIGFQVSHFGEKFTVNWPSVGQ